MKNWKREGQEMREELLALIEKNSRIDLGELAVLLGAGEAEVVSELSALEQEGIICGYHTMIDWEKTSREKVSALIEVRVTPQRGQGYDLMIILEGKTLREVSSFVSEKLSALESVISTATHFILKKYKDHGTVLSRKKEDERQMITP